MEKFPSFSWCIDRRKTLAKTPDFITFLRHHIA